MSVTLQRVRTAVQVYWPPGNTMFPVFVRAGSLVSIDMTNTALVAAYGNVQNLQAVTADLGSPDSLDKSWMAN